MLKHSHNPNLLSAQENVHRREQCVLCSLALGLGLGSGIGLGLGLGLGLRLGLGLGLGVDLLREGVDSCGKLQHLHVGVFIHIALNAKLAQLVTVVAVFVRFNKSDPSVAVRVSRETTEISISRLIRLSA